MSKNTTEQSTQEIPYGCCHCGCGQQTPICKSSDKTQGYIKGKPHRFCMGHRLPRPLAERFWEKVDVRNPDECWPWLAFKHRGYGQLTIDYRPVAAPRISYEFTYGPIPEGLLVCHKCNNPSCCNPAHLYAGTDVDNSHDAMRAGHIKLVHYEGSQHGMAKLSEEQVAEIRRLYSPRKVTLHQLGARFHVSYATIWTIVKRKTWKHIP